MHSVWVHTDSLPSEGRVFPLTFAPDEVNGYFAQSGVVDVHAVTELTGEARVLPSGQDVFVLGAIRCRVRYDCVRCLEPFEEEASGEFHRVYTRAPPGGGDEVELSGADLEVEFLEGEALDLAGAAGEELLLALNPHPVCREQCAGLCPNCGTNRNERECGCASRSADQRFAVLAGWGKTDNTDKT